MSKFSAISQNRRAVEPMLAAKRQLNSITKCCWKCQQSKQTTGGKLVIKPGLFMFICKECMDAKKEAAGT